MKNARLPVALASILCLLGGTSTGRAGTDSGRARAEKFLADARVLAARIDVYIAGKWKDAGAKPAPRSDDGEFIRRVYLDLTGRIPSLLDARDFLDDDRPDKRWIWVNKLLDEKDEDNPNEMPYARHFAAVWRHTLLPSSNNPQAQYFAGSFEAWLRERLKSNTPYDGMVRELLTAPAYPQGFASPSIFYQANEMKPENLAASTSRLFLGHKLECAQCHNHPFAKWKRRQFWELAAFFSGISPQRPEQSASREIKIGGTGAVVQARFLDGTTPVWKEGPSAGRCLPNG